MGSWFASITKPLWAPAKIWRLESDIRTLTRIQRQFDQAKSNDLSDPKLDAAKATVLRLACKYNVRAAVGADRLAPLVIYEISQEIYRRDPGR